MEARSNSAISRSDYTVDMEHSTGFNLRPAKVDNSAFCDCCGFWKHDTIKQNGKTYCGPCNE